MQTTGTADNNGTMEVDDGHATQSNDQPDSQESISSDNDDKIISHNENFQRIIRETSSITEIETALAKKLVDINYTNKHNDTSLHLAVRRKNIRIVDLLIRRGANVTIRNKYEKTPLLMVEERLNDDPNNANLKSIRELLWRAQSGPSRKRSFEGNDSD